jgi:alkyl hydroperoxide reductase subunit AhpC
VLLADRGMAYRTTFVIDKEGRIQHIEQGNSAVDPTGAVTACSRLAHRK